MSKKYSTIHYHSYLKLDKILEAQQLRSVELGEPAHEEMLFIIIHQAYELWFKQIIHELQSILKMFREDSVDERNIGTAVARLGRISEILKLAVQQIRIMETMTPLDFLDFRGYLFPASGFQSFQFRMVEAMLGLSEQDRLTYSSGHYASVFPEDQQQVLADIYRSGTLFDAVESWLERTPFINYGEFDFLKQYEQAVRQMIEKEQEAIKVSVYLTEKEKIMRLAMLGNTDTYFQSVLSKDAHAALKANGKLRLSYDATVAALFINLYRDEPILHLPFRLLVNLMDIDELLTSWRQRHAQMVLRMLGRKMGTGGSSGHEYLQATAAKHHIFTDLHSVSTLLIPRSALPALPESLTKQLSFYFTQN
ncbi:tryptophan 2,3-dioxygenase family protein [Fulvivirgaceae bacterium BMA12]|uniref:Tryptophan 2,3-dioxygenase n=1 Tax=Agaribacillus aureus TaxID=3051825 RepID=A0ABT8L4U6_9BACT|nr:tryptophan 2,3-dioxygenase family protein [Fulvivirgaceae bacterium BMA12]